MLLTICGIFKSTLHELEQFIDCLTLRQSFQLSSNLTSNAFLCTLTHYRLSEIRHLHLRIMIKHRHKVSIYLPLNVNTIETETIFVSLIRNIRFL